MRSILASFLFILCIFPSPALARVSNDPAPLQKAYQQVGAPLAWDVSTGRGDVVVAIIDNGFDAHHPDLQENVWKNRDEIPGNQKDDDKNGFIDDVWGWDFAADDNDPNPDMPATFPEEIDRVIHHATVVAGIVGAVGNNGRDSVGINWKVQLMNVRAVDNTGVGDLDALARAIRYAVDNGAHIINISMVGNGDLRNLRSALDVAVDRGVVVIAAAGNNGQSLNEKPQYPACLDWDSPTQKILGVSAVDSARYFATFSNFGSNCIDITAPGTEIESTLLYLPNSGLDVEYSGLWSGTSFAAPFVSGAAALVKSIQPTWKAAQIYPALQSTTHRTLGSDPVAYANFFGSGLLQINRAVQYAQSELTTPKSNLLHTIVSVSRLGSRVSTRDVSAQKQKNTVVSNLEKINQLVPVEGVEGIAYAAMKIGEANTSDLILLDQKFAVKKTISLPFTQAMNVVVAKLDQQEESRIILSPVGASGTQVLVYTLSGKKLFEKRLPKKHNGTFLAVQHDPFLEKNTLAVITKGTKNAVSADILSDKGVLIESIPLELPAKPTGFGLLNLSGDESEEFVFSYEQEGTTRIALFQSGDGILLYSFSLPERLSGGTTVWRVDSNQDGQDELIVGPKKGLGPVQIVKPTGESITSWYPFGKDFDRGIFLLGN